MPFHPSYLPLPVRREFIKCLDMPILWPAAVKAAYDWGMRDANDLANIVFYLHHQDMFGKKIAAGDTKLSEEWLAFRVMVKAMLPGLAASSSSPASGSSTPAAPDLGGLLDKVDPDSYVSGDAKPKHLRRMKKFLAEGLGGAEVDDLYWHFSYFDGFGREYRCDRKGSVGTLERGSTEQHALKVFKRLADGATTVNAVGKALAKLEATVACNTFVVIRWAHTNAGTGDGRITHHREMGYLAQLAKAAQRQHPPSVYSCYEEDLVKTYDNAR